jgi:hypothetical protein
LRRSEATAGGFKIPVAKEEEVEEEEQAAIGTVSP